MLCLRGAQRLRVPQPSVDDRDHLKPLSPFGLRNRYLSRLGVQVSLEHHRASGGVCGLSRRFVVVVLADAGSLLSTSVFTGLQECPQMSCASVCPVTLPETDAFGLINVYFCMHLDVFV